MHTRFHTYRPAHSHIHIFCLHTHIHIHSYTKSYVCTHMCAHTYTHTPFQEMKQHGTNEMLQKLVFIMQNRKAGDAPSNAVLSPVAC